MSGPFALAAMLGKSFSKSDFDFTKSLSHFPENPEYFKGESNEQASIENNFTHG
jgi:hypothetical protein